jgi:protein-disulfide isomerase
MRKGTKMKNALLLTSATALLALAGCNGKSGDATKNASVAQVAPPAGTSWTETVSATPSGGFVMGNPAAPVKLVEYGSLTCSHCAEFSEKGYPKLAEGYVSKGQVSYEFRNYVRDPYDVVAALTVRCGGPGPFFLMSEQLYKDQPNWFAKLQAMTPAEQEALSKMPPAAQFASIATKAGFDSFALQRGIPGDKLNACFADQASVKKLEEIHNKANTEVNLTGTPTFTINDAKVDDAASWEALEPAIRKALGV